MKIIIKKFKLIKYLQIIIGVHVFMIPYHLSGQQPKFSDPPTQFQIRFIGNSHYNNRGIRELLDLSTKGKDLVWDNKQGESKEQFNQKLTELLTAYHNDGYLAAEIDSIRWPDNNEKNQLVEVFLVEGEPFKVNQLVLIGNHFFSKQQIRRFMRIGVGSNFYSQQLQEDVQEIINQYAEKGYLLAKIDIQKVDIDFQNSTVDLLLLIEESKPIAVNQIAIEGLQNTNKNVITRELGLNHKILTSSKLSSINDKMRRLKFLDLIEPPRLTFTEDTTGVISLNFQENKSSQFDGVVGFNPKQGNQDGFVSGQVRIIFDNLLGTGRSLRAFWDKRNANTQSLQLDYEEPWLFGKPIHGAIGLEQIVQDTTFVRRNWQVGLRLFLLENILIAAKIGRESVLPDSVGRALHGLPKSQADRLHLEVGLDNRDHPWNPTSGLLYQTNVDFVRKRIEPIITGEETQTKEFRRISLDLEYIQKLSGRNVLMAGLHGRQVRIGTEVTPIDELFRIGGASDLRGYREDQFLGDRIAWGTLEYRLLLDKTSRLSIFVDSGYIEKRDTEQKLDKSYKSGYGFGLRTQTNLGIIGFDYALGEGDQLNQGKIHIRLINIF